MADNRAALAIETGLAKPTVSDLISLLMDEGFLIETGRGQSSETGGKRPRLLEFVPKARQVIGISISEHGIAGLLSDLNGQVLAEHILPFDDPPETLDIDDVQGVINGLIAQLDAPLLCLGVGVPGDIENSVVTFPHHLSWQPVNLVEILEDIYEVPVYIEGNTELAAIAQFAFEASHAVSSLAIVLVNSTVEVGFVLGDTEYHSGRNIGEQKLSPESPALEDLIGWQAVKQRIREMKSTFSNSLLPEGRVRYLDIRYGAFNRDEASLQLCSEFEDIVARIFSWIITLLHPEHLSLAGGIADLGQPFLDNIITKTTSLIPANLVEDVHFALVTDTHLSALGAIAYALQHDLGLIQWQNESV